MVNLLRSKRFQHFQTVAIILFHVFVDGCFTGLCCKSRIYRLRSPPQGSRNAMKLSKMARVDGFQGAISKSYLVPGFDIIYEMRTTSV